MVEKISGHILFAGGKRLRPLLMITAARACGHSGNDEKKIAVLFEYLHAATLLHDDLVDEAIIRRGKDAANLVFGNAQAVLTGDFLLARSLSLAASTGNPEIINIIARVTEDMSQGEIYQLNNKGQLSITEEQYMDVIQRKTASLLQGATESGALLAGAKSDIVNAFANYGHHLGIAFQMADDLLDYTSDLASLGKAPGADLKEGKMTLPLIFALKNGDANDTQQMKAIICRSDFSVDDFLKLRDLLIRNNGISYTKQMAEKHVNSAIKSIQGFGLKKEYVHLLTLIAKYALERKN
jgi:octaprenyl-diphosphate synthase